MSKPVVEVQVRAVAAVSGGCAVFLGNEDKVFVMFVDQSVGAAITMFMQGTQKERPLTHDLLANVLRALGAKIDRVVVNDLKDGTYFARLVLSAENESHQKKIIEIDARPSDCIAMATQQLAPIFVSLDVWDEVEDMTEVLRKCNRKARIRNRATRKKSRRHGDVGENDFGGNSHVRQAFDHRARSYQGARLLCPRDRRFRKKRIHFPIRGFRSNGRVMERVP